MQDKKNIIYTVLGQVLPDEELDAIGAISIIIALIIVLPVFVIVGIITYHIGRVIIAFIALLLT